MIKKFSAFAVSENDRAQGLVAPALAAPPKLQFGSLTPGASTGNVVFPTPFGSVPVLTTDAHKNAWVLSLEITLLTTTGFTWTAWGATGVGTVSNTTPLLISWVGFTA